MKVVGVDFSKRFTLLGSSLLFVLLIVALFFPMSAESQSLPGLSLEALQLKVSPEFPGPGQEVTAVLSSTVIDLDRARITWEVNRKVISTQGGTKQITFKANGTGATTQVGVTVVSAEGRVLDKEVILRTATLDLLWEASSYTPPFYKGKGLSTAGSTLKVTAIPDIRNGAGRRLSNDELVFTWKQAARVVPEASGRGKSTASFPGPELYKDFDVTVEVMSIDQKSGAFGQLTLPAYQPQLFLYESHPTLGIRFEEALNEKTDLPGGEITVAAQPYFVESKAAGGSELRYKWSLNGETVANPSVNPSLIVLRADGAGGSAQVGVTVEHTSKIFQRAQRLFDISFAGESSL